MTVHSVLVANWPNDIDVALAIADASRIYFGREPRQVTSADKEIWIERLPVIDRQKSGFEPRAAFPYRIHIRVAGPGGNDKAWSTQVSTVEADLQLLRTHYHGKRRLDVALSAAGHRLICTSAEEESVDRDPGDEKVLDGSIKVTWEVAT